MEISFEKIIRIVRKNVLIIIASAVLFFGIALAVMTFAVAPTYTVSAKFLITDPTRQASSTAQQNSDYTYDTKVVNTYSEILKSTDFFTLVRQNLPEDLKNRLTVDQIKGNTSFSITANTEIISVTYQSTDKQTVYPVMKSILDTIQPHISFAYNKEEIEKRQIETPGEDSVRVSNNRTRVFSLIAAVLGAIAAIAFFMIRDALDVHIRGANDIVERYKLPVLGRIPSFDPGALRKKEAAGDGSTKE